MFTDAIREYKDDLSVRRFAALLSERLDPPISYGSVANWLAGKHRPDVMTLLRLQAAYPVEDWRHRLALIGIDQFYRVV